MTIDETRSVVVNSKNGLCKAHLAEVGGSETEATSARDDSIDRLKETGSTVELIELAKIRPRADQPRQEFDEEELISLADGLQLVGQQQPAIVVPIKPDSEGCTFELDDGERRWRACKIAGINTLKCIIVPEHLDVDDGLRFLRSAVANFNRSDHTLLEEVDMVVRLVEEFGHSQAAIARSLGRHAMWVNQRYSLRRLHPLVKERLRKDAPAGTKLGLPAALRLAPMDPDVQLAVAPKMVGTTTAHHNNIINDAVHAGGFSVSRRTRAPSDDFRSVERSLKTAVEKLELAKGMHDIAWSNAFRYQDRVRVIALREQVQKLQGLVYICYSGSIVLWSLEVMTNILKAGRT